MKEITEYIQEIVQEKTLSLDGLKALDAIKEQNIKLTSTNQGLKDQKDALRIQCDNQAINLNACKEENDALRARDLEVSSKEKINLINELKAIHQEERREEILNILMSLTRNIEIRKGIYGDVPMAVTGGSTGCGFVGTGIVNTMETEKKE